MSKVSIGIDPDSKAHGVAIYVNGKLTKLLNYTLLNLFDYISLELLAENESTDIKIHIEDVCANNAVFRTGHNKNVQQSIARRLGMVQQSQAELERLFEYLDIEVVKHKISKTWKEDKSKFERVTGWSGRSNQDTRSAAYFGFLGVRS